MSAILTRIALTSLAIILILAGLVVLPLPIPLGAVMIITGLGILVSSNEGAASWIMQRRVQNPRLNRWLAAFEHRLPGRLADILKRTTPDTPL